MLVSVTSLATISCDRMIGVVRPFHNHLKKSYSLTIIIIIWVSSAVLAVPWAVYRVYTVHIWQDMTQAICNESEDLQIWWIISVIGLAWLPLSVMVVCYATILVYFNHRRVKHPAFRCEHPVITHLKKRVVKMMFAVVVIFIVCWLPFTLLQITYSSFLDENGQFKDEATKQNYNDLLTLGQYMIYVNAALNPIIYGLLHQTFRRAFRVTFPCVFKRKSSLVLTRGQGLTRYMWSVKSTTGGQQPSVRTRGGSSSSIQPNIQRELTFDPPQDPTSATSQDPTPATPQDYTPATPQDPTPATSQDPTPVTLQDSIPATSQDCTTAFSRQDSTTTGGPHHPTFSSLHDPTIASPHAHTPSSTPPATTTQHPNKRKKKKKIVCFTKDLPGGRVAASYDKRENARCYSLKSICPCGDRKKKLLRARSNSYQDETGQPVRDVGVGSVGVGGERRTTEGIPWRRKEYHKEGDPCRKGGFSNEGYVRDLPPPKFSIVSKGALGDLIKQVIVEETSSDVEHERIL
ncbi:hypothetical protein Pmani_036061 [Petrolisthes manimaculis]|uniref:G-protein coupled receptors family 1 profile domain-containing protein n=1 Tax=Petrolisthes manimaculis TaxID=1843537 RepID=A0AAE1TPS9_9EUCA|nr:hypothetical protein Pmani_036061 [Petrolisthes manimaculis]